MEDISMERTSRRTPRKISENVRELHTALSKVLKNEDRTFLIQSLNQYQRERNVNSLVGALKSVLDTPTKKEVYPLLWQIIPHSDQEVFRNLWHRDVEAPRQRNSKSPARSPGNLRRNPNSSSLPDNLHRQAADSGIDLPNMTQFHSSKDAKYPVKRLTVKRPSNTGFGFCVRGGAEHGVGLYVSSVDENSVAEKEGLLPGDHVIQVNSTKFHGLTHAQAVKIIQDSKKLNLIVRSVGRVPDSFVAESTCKWVDMRGRKVSPPPGVDSNGRILTADGIHKSDLRLLGDDDERKVNIFVEDGAKLGLMIRGGSEYGLGVYIAGVDPDCAADQAGLTAGDQILDVNGQSFLNITHKHAVKVLKSTKNMIVTLKDIGRLPFTRVTHDKTKWIAKSAKQMQRRHTTAGRMRYENEREPSMFHHGIAGSQVLYNGGLPSQKNLLTEQARQILNENELGTLDYYLEEYCKGYITVSGFALALFDLLNTPAKMSLITEIRSSVAPKDIDRFDDLVLKKEIEIMKSRRFFGNHMDDDRHSLNSYASSVSSVSGRGSSSRSSIKGSLDGTGSRPITPPQVPEVLPPNVKVDNDVKTDTSQSYEVYEATLTFHDEEEQTFEDEDMLGLPNFLNINPMSLDLPETESTSVPSPVGVSTPLFTSSPMNEHNGQVSPTRTVGEATASLTVGDNLRKEKHGKDSPPLTNGFRSVNIMSDESTAEGHRITTYANEEGRSTGLPSPPKHNVRSPVDFHSKKEPQKSQSPTNPFIFQSTFQGSITDNKTSISALFESSATKQNNSADSSPREHIVMQTEVQPKNDNIFRERRQNDFIASPTDHDLRPEVAKLPGKKRLASWNEVQDETTLSKEATSSANDKRLPPVKPKPGSMATTESSCSSEQKDFRNHGLAEIHGDNLKRSEDAENITNNSAVVEDGVQLLKHLSNSSSSSSTSSERQRSSAANNRKSWDGVRHPGESEENQKVSRLEQQRDNKERSCSDSNLMNLPKEQQKIIQAKHKASQELFELHQQSKTKTHNANEDEKTNTVTLATRNSVQTPRKVNGVTESPFVVEVEKSSCSLGLILEGGSDMGSDVKIKAVKEGNFAAWKCGRLKEGQVLLQVDDTPLRGLTSGIAVLTLRHAYSNSDVAVLKLLVRDG